MKIKKIDINILLNNNIDLKEKGFHANKKLKNSLKVFGQIYPILIEPETNKIIKGMNLVFAMKELNLKTCFISEIKIKSDVELLSFKKLLYDSCDDINILKLSAAINELNKKMNINEIGLKTDINVQELINLIDLLKLDNLIKEKNEKKQPKLF